MPSDPATSAAIGRFTVLCEEAELGTVLVTATAGGIVTWLTASQGVVANFLFYDTGLAVAFDDRIARQPRC